MGNGKSIPKKPNVPKDSGVPKSNLHYEENFLMADIYPFRGVRYETARLQVPLANLVAPPYDVISPDEQAALYEKNPHNIVRLILGREADKYENAGKLFRQWLAEGTLTIDLSLSVYVYHQTFRDPTGPGPDGLSMPAEAGRI
jgi:hypothetical protein